MFTKVSYFVLTGKEIHLCWILSHVGITGNERADFEAKAALQFPVSDDCLVPQTDYRNAVSLYVTKHWQLQWNNVLFNKLQPIKKTIGDTKFGGIVKRRDEIVLHRALIGHTYLTHCYLLKDEDQSQCAACNCALTVKHIIINCPDLQIPKINILVSGPLWSFFSNFPLFITLNFLRDIGFYRRH